MSAVPNMYYRLGPGPMFFLRNNAQAALVAQGADNQTAELMVSLMDDDQVCAIVNQSIADRINGVRRE